MLRFAQVEDDRNKVVSALAQLEARSAIARLRKGSRMNSSEASLALISLAAEMRRMIEQPVNPTVLEAASSTIDRYCLRAMDAAQLGCAIVARDILQDSQQTPFAAPGTGSSRRELDGSRKMSGVPETRKPQTGPAIRTHPNYHRDYRLSETPCNWLPSMSFEPVRPKPDRRRDANPLQSK